MAPQAGRSFALAVWVMLSGIAIGGACVQFDHASRKNPNLAKYVPTPFREQSLLQILGRDAQAPDALGMARLLVVRRPIPAESLSMFAVVAFREGDQEAASGALAEAATRGWREPVSQLAMVEAGLASGQWDIALSRLVALWRTGRRDELLVSYVQRIAESPEGREALLRRFVTDKAWFDAFFEWAPSEITPAALTRLVDEASARGLSIDCGSLRSAALQLARAGEGDAMQQIWSRACANFGAPSGSFRWAKPGFNRGPFDWSFSPDGQVDWSLSSDIENPSLTATNRSPFAAVAATRFDVLGAGTYSVQITMKARPKSGDAALKVVCVSSEGISRGLVSLDASSPLLRFTVPPDCSVQRYDLLVGATKVDELRLDVD